MAGALPPVSRAAAVSTAAGTLPAMRSDSNCVK